MTRIYSYVLRYDDGAAPNPFQGVCTLTICKPVIRKKAQIGDWVIGTGSKNVKLKDGSYVDFSDSIVYAMKVSDVRKLEDYDDFCRLRGIDKTPNWKTNDWTQRVGDAIYDYSHGPEPIIRPSVHKEENRKRDLSGINTLISEHFYYFGIEARPLREDLKELIKKNQGHKKIERPDLVAKFEEWISQFKVNNVYADPQLRWWFDKALQTHQISACAKHRANNDEDDKEESLC